jgi:hypothetical protein
VLSPKYASWQLIAALSIHPKVPKPTGASGRAVYYGRPAYQGAAEVSGKSSRDTYQSQSLKGIPALELEPFVRALYPKPFDVDT